MAAIDAKMSIMPVSGGAVRRYVMASRELSGISARCACRGDAGLIYVAAVVTDIGNHPNQRKKPKHGDSASEARPRARGVVTARHKMGAVMAESDLLAAIVL